MPFGTASSSPVVCSGIFTGIPQLIEPGASIVVKDCLVQAENRT